jgi:hypothetical protein
MAPPDVPAPENWGQQGKRFLEEGRIADAVPALVLAIAAEPGRGEPYRLLAEIAPEALSDAHVAALAALAGAAPGPETAEINFALGRLAIGRGEHARGFDHFRVANAAARAAGDYDETATLRAFEQIAATFSSAYLAERRATGCASDRPIFIFGMPRSGTTLIEQILASHPAVFAAGERTIFDDITAEMLGPGGTSLRALGERYVAEIAKIAPPSALRVTDKMPANFRFAGLIHLALPNARMIHARRDPVETCLSCFSNSFAAGGLAWTCDLGELGRYCRGYLRLMEHWRTALPPGAMLEVDYEDVVDDLETQARRIVAYCGLPWDDRCLEFYKTERPVKTASVAQVRRPIYRTSLKTADAYGEAIRPLLDALGR